MASKNIHKLSRTQAVNLSENLSELMARNGVTDRSLSDAIGVPYMSIRRLSTGETTDPRISTLNAIADYFNVAIDQLIGRAIDAPIQELRDKPVFIPILDWGTASKIDDTDIDFSSWGNWQAIPKREGFDLSDAAFALTSTPSMRPRFAPGTVIIVDPQLTPQDGDVVIVRILETNELTIRDLIINPPEWKLESIVHGSESLIYSPSKYKIAGVVVLTMLYNSRF